MSDYLEETPIGTVIRPEWEDVYYKDVIKAEQEARRAVCGAPKKDGDPCKGRPQKDYGYSCRLHRYSGDLQLTSQEVKDPALAEAKLPVEQRKRPPILLNDEIRHVLLNCNVCPVKRQCSEMLPGNHCVIEERAAHRFVATVKQDYQVEDIDMFSVLQAAFSWINAIRARISQSRMDPVDAEATRVSWTAPREMKEFTRIMKELGLTRKERIDQEKDRLGLKALPSSVSLAEIMSALETQGVGEVTVTQATQTTIKKTEDDTIDVEIEPEIKPENT